MAIGTTKTIDLVKVDILSDLVNLNLEEEIKFAPLATLDTCLVGQPGDTVKLPKYSYIGDATDVTEGNDIDIVKLSATAATASVKKAAKGIEITDEAVLSGYGDPLGTAAAQLRRSITQKVDDDCYNALCDIAAPMVHDDSENVLSADMVADALVKFGQNLDGQKILLIAPSQLAMLRKDDSYILPSDMGMSMLMEGTVGMVHGCQIVISDKIADNGDGTIDNFIVKPGALSIFLKRDTNVETARNIVNKTTTATVDKHYVVYLADESKAVKIIAKTAAV